MNELLLNLVQELLKNTSRTYKSKNLHTPFMNIRVQELPKNISSHIFLLTTKHETVLFILKL